MVGGIVPLAEVPKTTLVDGVIRRLEELITSGEWPVGSRVPPEPELVRALGVSRNTVREAVRALVHAGLLDPRPGDGTYVRADTGLDAALERAARRWGALDALEVRSMLERDAARLAAKRRDADDLTAIGTAFRRRQRAAAGPERGREFVEADAAFHQALVAATHNRVLIELYAHLADPLRQSVTEVLRAGDDGTDASHRALADAIEAGDPDAAEDAATGLLAISLAALGPAPDDGQEGDGRAADDRAADGPAAADGQAPAAGTR
jgi:DNA-binding FadR family transcriptional regulator